MAPSWHEIHVTSDAPPEHVDGKQVLLPPAAPDANSARLVVNGNGRVRILAGGMHSDQHKAACASAQLVAQFGQGEPPTIRYRSARDRDRLRYDADFRWKLVIGFLGLLGAVASGVLVIVQAANDKAPSVPLWLVLVVSVLVLLAAVGTTIQGLRGP